MGNKLMKQSKFVIKETTIATISSTSTITSTSRSSGSITTSTWIDELIELNNNSMEVNVDNLEEKIQKALICILLLKEPVKIIVDKRAYLASVFLEKTSINNDVLCNLLIKNSKYIELFANIMLYYINHLKDYVMAYEVLYKGSTISINEQIQSTSDTKTHGIEFEFIIEIISILCNVTYQSKLLCLKFHEYLCTKALLSYLNDSNLIKECIDLRSDKSIDNATKITLGLYLLRIIISTLHNISVIADYCKGEFQELNATKILFNFCEQIKAHDSLRLYTHMTLANIMTDMEIEQLLEKNDSTLLNDIVTELRSCANMIELGGDNLQRIKVEMDDSKNKATIELCSSDLDGWHIADFLCALNRLSVNDKIKSELYFKYNLYLDLEKILFYGNQTEQEYALRLVYQLVVDKSVSISLSENRKLYDYIIELARVKTDLNNKYIRAYSNGIIWKMVQNKCDTSLNIQRSDSDYFSNQDQSEFLSIGNGCGTVSSVISSISEPYQIFISYNKDSKDICYKTKQKLEKLGLSIWMDYDSNYGFNMNIKAKAIENSKCFIAFITENYKQCTGCRNEIQYAIKMGIPVITIIMQRNYTFDGWLEVTLKEQVDKKRQIDFTKYTLEECMKRLITELRSYFNINLFNEAEIFNERQLSQQKAASSPKKSNRKTLSTINTWSDKEVRNWLLKINCEKRLVKTLRKFDGCMLKHLNMIRSHAPEYYYKALSNNNNIPIFFIIKFTMEMEKLFDF